MRKSIMLSNPSVNHKTLALAALTCMGLVLLSLISPAQKSSAAEGPDDSERIDLSRPANCPSICKIADQTRVEPPVVLTGESATVVLPIHPICAAAPTWLRIMIVVDPSSEIDNRELDEVKAAIMRLADQLKFGQGEPVEMGLIQVTTHARVLSPYTADRDVFERALNRLRRDETIALDRAIDAAQREYQQLLAPDCIRGMEANEMTILFAADQEVSCAPAVRAASKLKANHNLLIAIDSSPDSQATHCMRQMATSSRYHFYLNRLDDFYRIFEPIRNDDLLGETPNGLDDTLNISIRDVSVIETLNDGFQYIPESAETSGSDFARWPATELGVRLPAPRRHHLNVPCQSYSTRIRRSQSRHRVRMEGIFGQDRRKSSFARKNPRSR